MRGLVRNSYTLADTPEVPTFVVSFFSGAFFSAIGRRRMGILEKSDKFWRNAAPDAGEAV